MNKIIYRFALFVALVTLVLCLASQISIVTSLFRSAIVFVGVLFTIFVFGNVLRLGIYLTPRKGSMKND